jgi:hypothetical protein
LAENDEITVLTENNMIGIVLIICIFYFVIGPVVQSMLDDDSVPENGIPEFKNPSKRPPRPPYN